MTERSEPNPGQKRPNFFLVGAPKAGTTALYHYLDQHPGIYMSPIKEPNFLADELRLENFSDQFRRLAQLRLPAQREYLQGPVRDKFSGGPVSEWTDYRKLFQGARNETAIGEASASYLWSETAPRNIAARFPHGRILMILRNPVERALSQYAHMLSFAEDGVAFREYMDVALRSNSTRIGEHYPFLRYGLYAEQLTRYQTYFAADQMRILLYEDFSQRPLEVLRGVFQFLDVDPAFAPDLSLRHMEARVPRSFGLRNTLRRVGLWDALKRAIPKHMRCPMERAAFRPRKAITLSPEDRRRLAYYYREDVDKLSQMLGRDLSVWLKS